jgi:hypothetical protein
VADVNAGIQGRRRGLVIRRSSRTDSRLPTPFARRRGDAIPWRRFARLSTVAMSRRYPRRVRAQLTAPNRPFALRAGRAASPALAVPPPAAASAARAAPACRGSPRSSSRAVPGALRSAHARPRSARRVRRVTAPARDLPPGLLGSSLTAGSRSRAAKCSSTRAMSAWTCVSLLLEDLVVRFSPRSRYCATQSGGFRSPRTLATVWTSAGARTTGDQPRARCAAAT